MKNIQSMTRHQAERAVQTLDNGEDLAQAMSHKNHHVGRAAFRRGMILCWAVPFFGMLAEILHRQEIIEATAITDRIDREDGFFAETKSEVTEQMDQLASGFDAHLQASYKALAEQYGEEVGYVETIALEKNGDLAAVKRSLISRKAARTVAAKKNATPKKARQTASA